MNLKINDLADLNLRELTKEECASLQGGLSWTDGGYSGGYFEPPYYNPQPKPNPSGEPVINNVPCTNSLVHGSDLPWCAVVL